MKSFVPEVIEPEVVNKIEATRTAIEEESFWLEVNNETDMEYATDFLARVSVAKKEVEKNRKFFVDPLNKQIKEINALFKGYLIPLDNADKEVRNKVLAYRKKKEQEAREAEKALQEQLEQGNITTPITVEKPKKTTRTASSTVSAIKQYDFNITDESQIPREYLTVNEKAIRAAVKAGVRNIPGVEIFEKEILNVRAY